MAVNEDDIPTGEFELEENGEISWPRSLQFDDLVRLRETTDEITERSDFRLLSLELFQPASDVVVSMFETGIGIAVPDHVLSFYRRVSDGVDFAWSYFEDGEELLGGGFHIYNFGQVFGTWVDKIWGVVPDDADVEAKDFSWELRPIEAPSSAGTHYTAMHVAEFAPTYQLYFHDPNGTSYRLDVDFPTYFDYLLKSRGFHGWQYLISDVDFEKDPVAKERAETFHRVMPRLFPDTDFSEFRKS